MNPILQLESVTRKFGGLTALDAVSFQINPGEIVGLIGPNGAGKTTLVNLVTAVYGVTQGKILFDGQRIVGLSPRARGRWRFAERTLPLRWMRTPRLCAAAEIKYRLRTFSMPVSHVRLAPPVSHTWAKLRSRRSLRRRCNFFPRSPRVRRRLA